ncbi:hypothetical protein ACK8P5_26620 (plasmid) [Paenibacillus sp. EC2-1]|uniref:hypothetical protein n=1 Tax=Paenibacillus sp. EC2-1 TaxID=3388665 RepID=UPI003BEF219E
MNDPYLDYGVAIHRLTEEWLSYGKIIIAYDFDSTVFDYHKEGHEYPEIIGLLQRVRNHAHFIVFTSCDPEKYGEIGRYLRDNDIPFDTINENMPFIPFNGRKVYYNILLDDRAGLSSAYFILSQAFEMVSQLSELTQKEE